MTGPTIETQLAEALAASRELNAAMAFGVPEGAWEACRSGIAATLAPIVDAAYQRGLTDMQNHPCTCDYAPGTHDPENPNCRFRVLLDAARKQTAERIAQALDAPPVYRTVNEAGDVMIPLADAQRIARAGQEPT